MLNVALLSDQKGLNFVQLNADEHSVEGSRPYDSVADIWHVRDASAVPA